MATTGPQVVDLEAVESAMSSMDSVLSLCGGKSAKAQVSLPPKALLSSFEQMCKLCCAHSKHSCC